MGDDKIIKFREDINSDFDGTVIDIETINDFDKTYKNTRDSREYQDLKQVIFGYINRRKLRIFCANGEDAINTLNSIAIQLLDVLERPFYAFFTHFESGVWFHQLEKKITFEYELQGFPRENKGNARKSVGIPNYDDPFDDSGKLCMIAWEKGQYDEAIAHNRACLLKERDLLIKRGTFTPIEMKFNK